MKSGIHNDSDGCDSLYNPALRRADYNIGCCSAFSLWYATRSCDVTRKWMHTRTPHRHTKSTCTCFARWNPSQINGGSTATRQLLNIYAHFLFYSLKQISNLGVSHGRAFLWFCSTTCGWCKALQRSLFFPSVIITSVLRFEQQQEFRAWLLLFLQLCLKAHVITNEIYKNTHLNKACNA